MRKNKNKSNTRAPKSRDAIKASLAKRFNLPPESLNLVSTSTPANADGEKSEALRLRTYKQPSGKVYQVLVCSTGKPWRFLSGRDLITESPKAPKQSAVTKQSAAPEAKPRTPWTTIVFEERSRGQVYTLRLDGFRILVRLTTSDFANEGPALGVQSRDGTIEECASIVAAYLKKHPETKIIVSMLGACIDDVYVDGSPSWRSRLAKKLLGMKVVRLEGMYLVSQYHEPA